MTFADDPFVALAAETLIDDDFAALERRPIGLAPQIAPATALVAPAVGRLHGFDLHDQPLIDKLGACLGEVVVGRSTVALRRAMIGLDVVVLFEGGDLRLPIIIGVIEPRVLRESAMGPVEPCVSVQVDGERHVVEAEREIVLRCGDASITLTRAGKVIIKGNYILSRSTGYNKIKGAAIDIN